MLLGSSQSDPAAPVGLEAAPGELVHMIPMARGYYNFLTKEGQHKETFTQSQRIENQGMNYDANE
jgi:hypothetical protein